MDGNDRQAEEVEASSASRANEIDEGLLELVKPELEPDERLLWAARANPRSNRNLNPHQLAFLWAAAFGILSVVFLTDFFGVFGTRIQPVVELVASVGALSGVTAFVIIIINILAWFINRNEPARWADQRYALTDRRAILWRRNPKSGGDEVFQLTPDKIRDIHRVEFPDGRGDVVFRLIGAHLEYPNSYQGVAYPTSFQGVADVRLVEGMARRVLLRRHPGKAERRAKKSE